MKKEDLQKYKEKLEEIRQEILEDSNETDHGIDLRHHGDLADIAAVQISTNILNALSDLDRNKISEINYALKKIDEGNYGVCEGTKKKIPANRLMYIPWTRYTAEYASIVERQKNLSKERSGE